MLVGQLIGVFHIITKCTSLALDFDVLDDKSPVFGVLARAGVILNMIFGFCGKFYIEIDGFFDAPRGCHF